MSWKIDYSTEAKEDLKSIYEYIAFVLLEPSIASKQVKAIMGSINKLDEMPERFKLYEHEPWRSKGLRQFSVGNYVVLYQPQENRNTVYIVRIMYGGRDIEAQLSE